MKVLKEDCVILYYVENNGSLMLIRSAFLTAWRVSCVHAEMRVQMVYRQAESTYVTVRDAISIQIAIPGNGYNRKSPESVQKQNIQTTHIYVYASWLETKNITCVYLCNYRERPTIAARTT